MKNKLSPALKSILAEGLSAVPETVQRSIKKGIYAAIEGDFLYDSICQLENTRFTVVVPSSDPVVVLRDCEDESFRWLLLCEESLVELPEEAKKAWTLFALACAYVAIQDSRFWADVCHYRREAFLQAALWAAEAKASDAILKFLLARVAQESVALIEGERPAWRASQVA